MPSSQSHLLHWAEAVHPSLYLPTHSLTRICWQDSKNIPELKTQWNDTWILWGRFLRWWINMLITQRLTSSCHLCGVSSHSPSLRPCRLEPQTLSGPGKQGSAGTPCLRFKSQCHAQSLSGFHISHSFNELVLKINVWLYVRDFQWT